MRRMSVFGLLALAALLAGPALGQVTVRLVLSTGSHPLVVDSVQLTADTVGTMFLTPGLGGDSLMQDTFDLPEFVRWPTGVRVFATDWGRVPVVLSVGAPVEDSWYQFDIGPEDAKIKFTTIAGGVENLPATEPARDFRVSPTLVRGGTSIISAVAGDIEIVDAAGNLVRTLPPGTTRWAGDDASGRRLAEGVYFCRLVAATGTSVRKVIIAD